MKQNEIIQMVKRGSNGVIFNVSYQYMLFNRIDIFNLLKYKFIIFLIFY